MTESRTEWEELHREQPGQIAGSGVIGRSFFTEGAWPAKSSNPSAAAS
jgi:hypothetical protein